MDRSMVYFSSCENIRQGNFVSIKQNAGDCGWFKQNAGESGWKFSMRVELKKMRVSPAKCGWLDIKGYTGFGFSWQ